MIMNSTSSGKSTIENSSRRRATRTQIISKVLTLPSKPEKISKARQYTGQLAQKCGFSEDEVFGIKLAVSEALTNAILHGSPCGSDSFVQIVFLCAHDALRIIVVDEGSFSPVRADITCDVEFEAENGRGLNLIEFFMDYVAIHPAVSGTSITMIKNGGMDQESDLKIQHA